MLMLDADRAGESGGMSDDETALLEVGARLDELLLRMTCVRNTALSDLASVGATGSRVGVVVAVDEATDSALERLSLAVIERRDLVDAELGIEAASTEFV